MLHGATIVFVTPGYRGKRFIYERAKELGVRSIVVDAPGSWAEEMVQDGTIMKFVPLDLERPSEQVLADCVELVKGFGRDDQARGGADTRRLAEVPLGPTPNPPPLASHVPWLLRIKRRARCQRCVCSWSDRG